MYYFPKVCNQSQQPFQPFNDKAQFKIRQTKALLRSTFCTVQQLVSMLVIKRHSCKTSLALHSKNNTRQGIFSFTEILMRADFLIGIVQQRSPYYFLLMESWASRLLSTVCGWFVQFNSTATTARKTQALQENLFCFQVISEAFKYFQRLSNTFRHIQIFSDILKQVC